MNLLALLHVATSPTVCDEGIEMTSKVGQKPRMKLLSIDYTYLPPLPIHYALMQWVLTFLHACGYIFAITLCACDHTTVCKCVV